MITTSNPGIVGTWFRNIDPNLPARRDDDPERA